MFWIALSTLIMSLTGEGDDTYAIREFFERARDAVDSEVHDAAHKRAALRTLDRATHAFELHRRRVTKISQCIERADRRYTAVAADYERCLADVDPAWSAAGEELIELGHDLGSALTPAELDAVRRRTERH
jgi:hypothetical protein